MTALDKINNYRLILASRSPRRKQLMDELGLKFEVIVRDYEEQYPEDLIGEEIALFLANGKAELFRRELNDNEIVITADTIVWCRQKVLGKPAGKEDAIKMIRELSGTTHEVITGVVLLSKKGEKAFCETTRVTFDKLTDNEIEYYIEKCRPFDKAGAYGIQEWIGIAGCNRVEGSYFNVVGLPAHRLYRELLDFISFLEG
ncbi:MAG TPA: Maf family nucleotide pyrophosphatase [Bacteroidales bacterium]|jgi:septum formation protein|nr:Maf family nucleotide pyrophosphatase [Bacteroidales bacterium]HQK68551.1 Maf family nucleotide pyrophosphatase [Bacteroidales bacterium]